MTTRPRLVLLGKQGAGKGTQAVRLSRRYVVPHLATGDIFRAAVRSGSTFGQKAKGYLDAGELVPDSVVVGMVQEQLTGNTAQGGQGFVLDGFPRTIAQAEALTAMLEPDRLDLAMDLRVDTADVLQRLAARRVCTDCGAIYSLVDSPPRMAGMCDSCGGEVVQRDDDTEQAIGRRLALYERQTAPLVTWFAERGLLAAVDGAGSPDEVTARLVVAVDQRLGLRLAPQGDPGAARPSVDASTAAPSRDDSETLRPLEHRPRHAGRPEGHRRPVPARIEQAG